MTFPLQQFFLLFTLFNLQFRGVGVVCLFFSIGQVDGDIMESLFCAQVCKCVHVGAQAI